MCNVINGLNKKAFQLNANRRFPVVGGGVSLYFEIQVNKFEHVWKVQGAPCIEGGRAGGARARGFTSEQVWTGPSSSYIATPVNRMTDITFPHYIGSGNDIILKTKSCITTWNFGTYGSFLEYVTLPFSIRLHTCIKCKVFGKECVLKLDLSLN